MPTDKKTPVKKSVKTSVKTSENKHDRFLRIAKPRVKKVMKSLKVLGNCSNNSVYSYNQKEVDKMFDTIEQTLIQIKQKFSNTKESLEFDF